MTARSSLKPNPCTAPLAGTSGICASARFNVQLVASAGGGGRINLGGAFETASFVPTDPSGLDGEFLSFFARKKIAAPAAAQTSNTPTAMATAGNFLSGTGEVIAPLLPFSNEVAGRVCTSAAVRT